MKPFEAYITPDDTIEVYFPEERRTICLDSVEGLAFASELVGMLRERYPSMLRAVEARFRAMNASLFAVMQHDRGTYVHHVVHSVCSCCFGERDHVLDFDGERFRMERPTGCRQAAYCPWNGYAERNRDSFMVICGAKREFGFTGQERRVALLIRRGFSDPDVIAQAIGLAPKTVRNMICAIYSKVGCNSMGELINTIRDEGI